MSFITTPFTFNIVHEWAVEYGSCHGRVFYTLYVVNKYRYDHLFAWRRPSELKSGFRRSDHLSPSSSAK